MQAGKIVSWQVSLSWECRVSLEGHPVIVFGRDQPRLEIMQKPARGCFNFLGQRLLLSQFSFMEQMKVGMVCLGYTSSHRQEH